ncbi:MAG: hypothetical protein Kow00122_07120 [Thermoleophilia bacterium]
MRGLGKFLFGGLLGAIFGFLVSPKRAQRVRDALLGKDLPLESRVGLEPVSAPQIGGPGEAEPRFPAGVGESPAAVTPPGGESPSPVAAAPPVTAAPPVAGPLAPAPPAASPVEPVMAEPERVSFEPEERVSFEPEAVREYEPAFPFAPAIPAAYEAEPEPAPADEPPYRAPAAEPAPAEPLAAEPAAAAEPAPAEPLAAEPLAAEPAAAEPLAAEPLPTPATGEDASEPLVAVVPEILDEPIAPPAWSAPPVEIEEVLREEGTPLREVERVMSEEPAAEAPTGTEPLIRAEPLISTEPPTGTEAPTGTEPPTGTAVTPPLAPADLKARIEETRRRIQRELEHPFGEPSLAGPSDGFGVAAEAARWTAGTAEGESAVLEEPEAEELEPPPVVLEPAAEPDIQPVAAPARFDVEAEVESLMAEEEKGPAAGHSGPVFDHEAMRRRIEETRNRLKAKAFDAMMSGEAALLARNSRSVPETPGVGHSPAVDEEVDETIESTLTEEDL